MQKALVYHAIFIVNRGIDDAVNALERLKNDRDAKTPDSLQCVWTRN